MIKYYSPTDVAPHTSTGEAPYTLLYNRDQPLPVQKLIQCVEPYKGENPLGKRIEQSRVALSTAAKMLEKMRANQKRHYLNRRATHKFQVGDLVLLKKHQADKMDLKWEPNYRVVKLPSSWSAVVENQTNGRMKRCNVGDLKPDWETKTTPTQYLKGIADKRYSVRKAIKAPKKLDV